MRLLRHLLPVFATLAISVAIAPAVYADDVYPHGGPLDIRQHGYQHGYRDGFERGVQAHAQNMSGDFHTPEFERADRGFEGYMGDREIFRAGYRDGYSSGYRDGYDGNRGRFAEVYGSRNGDFDSDRDRARDQADTVYAERRWNYHDVAGDIGYRDGIAAGAKDARTGHSYRPEEHDSWKDGDHGYSGSYGSKSEYKQVYRSSYIAGYNAGFGRR